MARYTSQNNVGVGALFQNRRIKRGLVWGVMIIGALMAFELFNFSTTEFALSDLLGELSFGGVKWATILAIAFCGIDFAGIARIFTPEVGADEPTEVWYLFGAWLLAATMNAMLTWWGVSIAILGHETLGNAVIDRGTLLDIVPVFVAVMVWLSRVLIIGTFSIAGDRLFSQDDRRSRVFQPNRAKRSVQKPLPQYTRPTSNKPVYTNPAPAFRPSPKPNPRPQSIYGNEEPVITRPEPTYHPISAKPRNNGNGSSNGFN